MQANVAITVSNTTVLSVPCKTEIKKGARDKVVCFANTTKDLYLSSYEINLLDNFEVEEGADFEASTFEYGYKIPDVSSLETLNYTNSDCININTYRIGNIESENQKLEFEIYPNPNSFKLLNIKCNHITEQTFVYIYDVFGNQKLSFHLTELESQIDLNHLSSGFYKIKIKSDIEEKYKSLVLN